MAPQRIDTHHHAVPDFYARWLESRGVDAGGMPIPRWSPEASRRHMKRTGVRTAILSVSTPQVAGASPMDARLLCRDLNTYLHELVVAEPGTFGYFATLPLHDLDAALDELAVAYDHLTADGVCLLGNVDGVYLGDPRFDPLLAELDRRQAVVFVHPTSLPGPAVPGLSPYVADFLLDTTRAALNLARHDVLTRFPRIRFLLAHAGGFVPFAVARLAVGASARGNVIDGFRNLRRFWFDTALSGTPWAMPSLMRFAAKDQVTYGSDFPYAPPLASYASVGFQAVVRPRGGTAVSHENAYRLFPRLVPVVPPVLAPAGTDAPRLQPREAPREIGPGHPDWELR